MDRRVLLGAVLGALALPSAAAGSGFYFADNGSRALSQGGAFAAQADDLTAVQHNPAGLSQLQGWHFVLDAHALNHDVRFLRRDVDGETPANEITNTGGVFLLPFAGVGYGRELAGRRFHAAIGVYGPPSVGRYTFPEPNYATNERGSFIENPIRGAPQRYGLIRNDIIILYPSLAASWAVHPKVSVGVTLQYVYARIFLRRAVTSIPFTPAEQRDEDPNFDSIANIEQHGRPTFTGILGVLYQPLPFLQLGASYRPPVRIETDGTTDIELGRIPSQVAKVEGNRSQFTLTLPQELKLGVRVTPLPALGVTAEAVYQGWQSVPAFVLEPEDITFSQGSAPAEPLHDIVIPQRWHHAWSGRLGVSYAFDFGLTARAGVLYERTATPDAYLNVEFLHLSRAFLNAGLEYDTGPVSLVLVGSYLPWQQVEVTQSEVRQSNTDLDTGGSVIGNGTYTTGGWIAGLGVRGRFGAGARPAPSPSMASSVGEFNP